MKAIRYTFGNPYVCTYCGEPADTIDHTIPYSWFRNTGSDKRKQEAIGFMTYSCRECNNILSSRIFPTIQDRIMFVQKSLRKRHRKEMTVVWDEEDLSNVSGRLKEYIEQQNRLNLKIRQRLSWVSSKEFLDMMNSVYEDVYYDIQLTIKAKEYFIDTDYDPLNKETNYRSF